MKYQRNPQTNLQIRIIKKKSLRGRKDFQCRYVYQYLKKSVDSSGGKANASLRIQFLFRIYYQIDTRFSFGTNMESCSVILNASYQLAI